MTTFDADLPSDEVASPPDSEPIEQSEPASTAGFVDEPLPPGADELIEFDGKLYPIVRDAHLTESEYVGREALATKIAISQGLKDPDGKRVARAKAYARRRYRGWLVGEIASL
jgi:hypothetical protein